MPETTERRKPGPVPRIPGANQTTLWLSSEAARRVAQEAERTGRTRSEIVDELIRQHIPAERKGRAMNTTEHYTMTDERAEQIAQLAELTVTEVRDFALSDWPEGDEHQRWLDTADPQEIADWILAGR